MFKNQIENKKLFNFRIKCNKYIYSPAIDSLGSRSLFCEARREGTGLSEVGVSSSILCLSTADGIGSSGDCARKVNASTEAAEGELGI